MSEPAHRPARVLWPRERVGSMPNGLPRSVQHGEIDNDGTWLRKRAPERRQDPMKGRGPEAPAPSPPVAAFRKKRRPGTAIRDRTRPGYPVAYV
jgi:hypothetical protein